MSKIGNLQTLAASDVFVQTKYRTLETHISHFIPIDRRVFGHASQTDEQSVFEGQLGWE